MRSLCLFPVLLALSQPIICRSIIKRWDDFSERHSWSAIPIGWEYHGDPHPNTELALRLGLVKDNSLLLAHLQEVSDPGHHRYGQHLSKEEVNALAAPHPDSVNIINEWLAHHGIGTDNGDSESSIERSSAGDWLTVRVPVSRAERMLDAKYSIFRNIDTGALIIRTLRYSVPHVVSEHLDLVAPTTYFGRHRDGARSGSSYSAPTLNLAVRAETKFPSCDKKLFKATPDCLRELYRTKDYVPKHADKNRMGVVGYVDQWASNSDLQAFFRKYSPRAVAPAGSAEHTFSFESVNNGINDQSNPKTESSLDLQFAMAMSYPTPTTFYSTGGVAPTIDDYTHTQNEPYLEWLLYMKDQTTIPQVISTSYSDNEQTVPPEYAKKVCNMFMELGARGTSLLFCSGDWGVGQDDKENCPSNDGTNTRRFQPQFPASCPYVTTVGATMQVEPEIAGNISGGGFSNYFDQPDYQKSVVEQYLKTLGTKYKGLYNPKGRAYPDISARGKTFYYFLNGEEKHINGTSGATPVAAAIVSLLNDYRMTKSLPPLGFLNPLLYSTKGKGFTDILSGSGFGCGTDGFSAVKGWDPVTGFGTPNFVELQKVVTDAANN